MFLKKWFLFKLQNKRAKEVRKFVDKMITYAKKRRS
ncbi:MAG: bL17 family ribosomal protein [Clostridium sp.]|nr:MAG: bL17 family ribosomal protein [Clostridium sp.]